MDDRGRNPVWDFIRALPESERNKCFEYIACLEETGEGIRRPVGDYLGEKLYELRPKQTRLIYFFMLKEYAVLVHAFRKKTNQIPWQEIRIARSRMEDFIRRVERGALQLEK